MTEFKESLPLVVPGCRYRNRKTGGIYRVFAIARHSETLEEMPVYVDTAPQSIRHQLGLLLMLLATLLLDDKVWVRPLQLFREKFTEVDEV